MVVAILLRHNALVWLPIFSLIIYWIFRRAPFSFKRTNYGKATVLLTSIAPLVLFLFFNSLIYSTFGVKETHPEDQVIAMETLGAVVENPALKDDLPYISKHLTSEYEEAYLPGNVAPVMKWGPIKAVDGEFNIHSEELRKEYSSLYTRAPITLIEVKMDGFLNMLFPEYRYWFHPKLDENAYNLVQNENFKDLRNLLIRFSQSIYSNKFFTLFFGEHFVWFFLNLLAILFLISRKKVDYILLLLLFIPFFYYLSYLLASTGPQFRFMFPATLLVQVVALSRIVVYVDSTDFNKLVV